jgi:hypothetical protein
MDKAPILTFLLNMIFGARTTGGTAGRRRYPFSASADEGERRRLDAQRAA